MFSLVTQKMVQNKWQQRNVSPWCCLRTAPLQWKLLRLLLFEALACDKHNEGLDHIFKIMSHACFLASFLRWTTWTADKNENNQPFSRTTSTCAKHSCYLKTQSMPLLLLFPLLLLILFLLFDCCVIFVVDVVLAQKHRRQRKHHRSPRPGHQIPWPNLNCCRCLCFCCWCCCLVAVVWLLCIFCRRRQRRPHAEALVPETAPPETNPRPPDPRTEPQETSTFPMLPYLLCILSKKTCSPFHWRTKVSAMINKSDAFRKAQTAPTTDWRKPEQPLDQTDHDWINFPRWWVQTADKACKRWYFAPLASLPGIYLHCDVVQSCKKTTKNE